MLSSRNSAKQDIKSNPIPTLFNAIIAPYLFRFTARQRISQTACTWVGRWLNGPHLQHSCIHPKSFETLFFRMFKLWWAIEPTTRVHDESSVPKPDFQEKSPWKPYHESWRWIHTSTKWWVNFNLMHINTALWQVIERLGRGLSYAYRESLRDNTAD